ncbi:MAG: hypothetical protein ABIJ92_04430 [Candidatus Aenigmatarchaeota archaeon]
MIKKRFLETSGFREFFQSLSDFDKKNVKKIIEKIRERVEYNILKPDSFLRYEFAGTRKERRERLRVFYRVCEECRRLGHDKIEGRCHDCPREDDIICLIWGDDIRDDETYKDKTMLDRPGAKIDKRSNEFCE